VILSGPRFQTSFSGDRAKVWRLRTSNQAEQIAFLRRMVTTYRGHHAIRELATDIVFRQARARPKDKLAHALAIGEWVQQHVTYVNEGEETFQTPIRTLANGYGDCDDHTTLIGSLLESIGIPSEVVGLEHDGKGFFHVFPRAKVRAAGRLIALPLDSTLDFPIRRVTSPIALAQRRHGPRLRALVL